MAGFVKASESENPDLFWGAARRRRQLRRRHVVRVPASPANRSILAGILFIRAGEGREVLRFFRDFTSTAPDEITTFCDLPDLA